MDEMNTMVTMDAVSSVPTVSTPAKTFTTGQVVGIGAGCVAAGAAAATGVCLFLKKRDDQKRDAEIAEKLKALEAKDLEKDIKSKVTSK